MKKTVGLWIDHQKAVIVFVTGAEEEIRLIQSDIEEQRIEEQGRQNGRSIPSDDIRLRVLTEHLNNYYETVISCIRDAESILLFGPGKAKGELKMTDNQIAAKVKEHFLHRSAAQ